ncbi:uncharacterized protein LOC132196280 [Neocloeon triangulifer]|uniref:uncharacterized protein LOC132196280 n=1 Tax=Neocloeon triangulifer TaxID=2078957 RepID=UPI00286F37E2|nr:uncharacterized protein LOC132196280 [Neocloeon triangulifer]
MEFSATDLVLIFRTLVFLLIPVLFVLYNTHKDPRIWKMLNYFQGPATYPILGNAYKLFGLSPVEIFQRICEDTREYGRLFRVWILSTPQVVIASAKYAEKILQGMQHHVKSNNYKILDSWMGQGLLTAKDNMWKVHRKILTPAFHFNILHEFLPIFNKNSKVLAEKLAKFSDTGEDFDIFDHVSLCALDIICESSMGTSINAQTLSDSPYVKAIKELNTLLVKRYFTPHYRINWIYEMSSLKRETERFVKIANDFTDKVIKDRRQYLLKFKKNGVENKNEEEGKRKTMAFLDLLLAAQEDGEQFMTDKDIRDQVSTFMFEGHDTVTTASCWTLFILGTHPEIQERVVEELRHVFGDSGRAPTMSDLAELKYLERCLKETLRLYPSVPFIERQLREDQPFDSDNGIIAPAGVTTSFNIFMLHRDPEHFPDPEKFDPDRFLPEISQKRHPYAYLPFSAGPRNCIGQKFAMMEEKIVVSSVLRRFIVEAAHKPEEAQLKVGLVLKPENGLRIRLRKRAAQDAKLRISVNLYLVKSYRLIEEFAKWFHAANMDGTVAWLVPIFRNVLFFVVPLVYLSIQCAKKFKFISAVEKIPGPRAWPLIGNAPIMMRLNLTEMFDYVTRAVFKDFGPRIRFWLVDKPHVVITKAADCEKIMQGMQHHMKSQNYHLMFDAWMGEGLLTSNDDKWRLQRKILTPAFHFNILHEFLPILSKNSKILIQRLGEMPEAKYGKDFNIFESVSLCALDIICESSMGTAINAQQSSQSPYVQAVNRLNHLLAKKYFTPIQRFKLYYNFSTAKKELEEQLKISNEFTDKVINERRQYLKSLDEKGEGKNGTVEKRKHLAFLDMLLRAQQKGEKYMTDKDLRDQVSTFMFEGHDTVTTGTCWALFMMGTHPEIQEQVVEELDQVFGDSGREPTMSDLAELKLLERCIKESLRLYPSVPFYERHIREDAIMDDGTVIPAGCSVGFSVYRIHRDPEQFPDPETFNPDRFLPENSLGRHPYAYLPFSAGPRNCIGQKFALMEEKVVISTVLRKFRVEAAHKPEDAELQMALVLRPKNGLRIRIFERSSHPKLAGKMELTSAASWLWPLIRNVLLFVVPAAYLWRKSVKRLKFSAIVDKIPGPRAWPFIGNAPLMLGHDLTEFFQYVCTNVVEEYGRLVRFWVVNKPQVIITKASDAEKILQGMQHHVKSENYRILHGWMGDGLLTSKDEKWRAHRKILTPAFHFNILHEFLPILNKNSKIMVEKLSQSSEFKTGKDFNIFDSVSLCALDIICESSMGTVINAQSHSNSPYVQAVNRLNTLLTARYFSPFLRFDWIFKFSSMKRDIDQQLKISDDFTDRVILERKKYLNSLKSDDARIEKGDKKKNLAFLDMLLKAQDEGGQFLTHKDLQDQVSTFMFEGHDTVTTATSWALFMMGTHPDIQEKVIEELDRVFGVSGRAPTMNDLTELKLLERCIKESLRLYPSVPFFERCIREDAILHDGTIIPAGCDVSFIAYRIHRDPEYFPDPEKFDPDRFLPENSQGRHPYAYLPFSAGPRNCIGQKFALMEEKVVISTVLRKFRVEAAHSPEEAELQVSIVLKPKNGLRVRLLERSSHPNLHVQKS